MPRETPCPICQRQGPWLAEPFAPFCSERCKMVDLGNWLGEEYRIASPITAEDLLELAEMEESDPDKESGSDC